jgi:hypothetical protein
VRRDRAAVEAREGRRPAERVAQLLIAVAIQFGPDTERAFVRADPDRLPDMAMQKRFLERTVVGDIGIRPHKSLDHLIQRQGRLSGQRR